MADNMQTPESCSHDCSSCGSSCSSREAGAPQHEQLNENSRVEKVIAVVSGKGGVGKSMVTALSAVAANRNGCKVGVMDADITGPSIPKMFGIHDKAYGSEIGIIPCATPSEVKLMSLNLLTENESDPVVWRGPVIAGAVTQFWTDVAWGDLDVMFIDMPPGTGDVPLTVFQSLPVDGIIVVTSPQELVSMIVEKAVKMAEMMNVPILGIVENMSYFECPDNGRKYEIFGKSHVDEIAAEHGLKVLAKLPIDPDLAALSDQGRIEFADTSLLDESIMQIMDGIGR
ncbi:Mrp/NBP35 family ATP-binding protein [Mogibacterium timidum]|uniref:Iron-sulfur cluster carrier protein n=2 Tax=Mogibacterium timidum TaxID=35519 RepID=X8ITC7_9FIRM|nr:Mrp/NBP35 family ATP-binding protein [Mogibacterium timidum]EUC52434.1 ParA/MinD ATPase-like protein [Mogibacterium timidum ATCC 33093]NWO23189.1 Mrp/NBP35 family ATP-binding protein [Mogibacterium timidum]